MSLKALSSYTTYARYAHYLPEKRRRETWSEITDRVFAMHERKYAKQLAESDELRKDFAFAKEMMRQKRVLGSQRALQFGGKWIEKANAKIFNCSFTYIDRPTVFQEIDYLLLCGCGVGFSVQKHHVKKLPDIQSVSGDPVTHQIADSIEGWADAVGIVINSYFAHTEAWPQYAGKRVKFDYSLIRPAGALIAGQFKAPGPKGLERSLERIRAVIERRLASNGFQTDEFRGKLRPIDAYDCIMHIGDSVLSGGIRRSATIALFSPEDEEMMQAKTGNWFVENPQRGRSNNSALLVRSDTTWEQFNAIIQSTKEFGEPAFLWCSDREHGTNPCFSRDTRVLTEFGWRSFGDLLGSKPVIVQDARVLGEINEAGEESWSVDMDAENLGVLNQAQAVRKTGENKDIYELTLECGRTVKATGDHLFATKTGMKALADLTVQDEILIGLPPVFQYDTRTPEFVHGNEEGARGAIKDSSLLHAQNKNFKAGYIFGLLESNLIAAADLSLIRELQLILQELGLLARIRAGGPMPSGYELVIDLDDDGVSKVIGVKYLGKTDVYCLQEDKRRTLIAEGMTARRCVEIGLFPQTIDGRSGVAFCNLSTMSGKYCDTKERFFECCRAATIIGTIQAGYTNFNYLTPESKQIADREALLGVSITGMMDNPEILLNPKYQQMGAKVCKETNQRVAHLIGVNPAARITCTKPEGSSSCVLQTASGIHPHHARRYLRRVQANRLEFPLQHYKATNPTAVESSVWSSNNTDEVISFACEVPKGAILKNDLDAVALLSKVKSSQVNWVLAGENPELSASPGLHHNISNTVTVRPDEWDKVARYIFDNREFFTGVSLLPASGDLDYPQAPFATVLTPEEIVREYGDGSILASGLVVDGLHAFDDNLWAACAAALGESGPLEDVVEPVEPKKPLRAGHKSDKAYASVLGDYAIELNLYYQAMYHFRRVSLQKDWIRRAKQFSERYFGGDLRRATYCLKHVSLWHTWLAINRNHKEIDWSTVTEDAQQLVAADTLAAQSCAGGACAV